MDGTRQLMLPGTRDAHIEDIDLKHVSEVHQQI